MNTDRKSNIKFAAAAFVINLLIALVSYVPFIIQGHGLFTLADDFNAQELAFNVFANREIKEFDVFFNWAIDIGSDFVSSFSFYNLGSPFFWITLIFKPETFPYLIGWILILKYAVAGLFSYLFLSRNTGRKGALIGSVLYAFSGFQSMNMIFYHFHDVVAFFPLLLIGLDECTEKKKKGLFAAAVMLNALVNWNFFVGEVFFCILYFLVRYDAYGMIRKKAIKDLLLQILKLMVEGVLGVCGAAVLFIPSVMTMLSNPRIGDSVTMKDGLIWSSEDLLRNLKGILLPAESMNDNSALSDMNWYSVSLYLPMVGGVFAAVYTLTKRKQNDWLCRMIGICLCIMAVPVFNNMFVMFNREPYRRWYYMFILMLALATARVIEDIGNAEAEKTSQIKKKLIIAIISFAAVIGIMWIGFAVWKWDYGMDSAITDEKKWTMTVMTGLVGLAVTAIMLVFIKKKDILIRFLFAGIAGWSVMTTISCINQYKDTSELDSKEVYDLVMNSTAEMDRNSFPFRYGILDYGGYFDIGMANSLPSIDSFISTVDNGIVEFYDALGVGRHALTMTGPVGTDRILSLKYWVTEMPEELGLPMDHLIGVYDNGSDKVYMVEDYYALPIGFTYDRYILRSEFDRIPAESRAIAMLTSLVVKDEDESAVAGILTHANAEEYASRNGVVIPELDIYGPEHTRDEFHFGRKSFGSTITCYTDKYAFYSVPYSDRWSATVNGEPVGILNINGLMAVPAMAGKNEINFEYDIRINLVSLALSICSSLVIIALIIIDSRRRKKES